MTRVYGPHNKGTTKSAGKSIYLFLCYFISYFGIYYRMPAYLSLNLMMHQHMCMASPLAQDDSREIFHIDT